MHSKFRRASIPLAVLLVQLFTTPVVSAQMIAEFDLPTQPLADALRAVARQTNTNVLFDRALVDGRTAPALKTQATADAALAHLLVGSGLTPRFVDEKTIVLEPAAKSGGDRSKNTSEQSKKDSLPDPSRQSPGAWSSAAGAAARIRLAQATDRAAAQSAAARQSVWSNRIELEEIVVTGSHIRGIENSTAPLIVLDRAYIDSTGVSTTTRLIESLPQNFALTTQSGVSTPGVSFSREQGAGINLRAIGEGTTLVLLNGRRMASGARSAAVDIAALPLSAIERVEIMTDGASALYGSDAVGGVVNFILRDDFEGAETGLRSGWADGGVNEYRFSQVLGDAWDSGNALMSLEYYKRDLLYASERDFVPSASVIGSLYPEDENYSAMFHGRQELSGTVHAFADALYTNRDSYNFGGRTTAGNDAYIENPQLTATLGLDWQVGGDWQIELSGSYARNKMDQIQNGRLANGQPNISLYRSLFEIQSGQIKADGSLFNLPGGPVRAALGADWRSESFEDRSVRPSGTVNFQVESDVIVRSAFGQVHIPVVGAANAVAGISRLELSLAGRYDDYSSFGSSFDPQVGLMWEPVSGLRLRGSHGTSYKAPNLVDYDGSGNLAFAAFFGPTHLMEVSGIDADGLSPQESENSSFGLEFAPDYIEGLQLAANYYRIEYTDRIANPPTSSLVILGNPSAFGSLIVQDPSVAQVNEFIAIGQAGRGFFALDQNFTPNTNFTPESVDVIVDRRRRNLSVVETSGLDLAMQYGFSAAGSDIYVGLAGTYILELVQQVTSASEAVDVVDTIYSPPDWRVRGSLGWRRQGWAASLFVNHTDSYLDNRTPVPTPVSSYTTVDARLAYDFERQTGFLSGVTVSATAQNLFDEDPPHTAVLFDFSDMGFDPTNANPMGRFVAVELVKTW